MEVKTAPFYMKPEIVKCEKCGRSRNKTEAPKCPVCEEKSRVKTEHKESKKLFDDYE